MFTSFTKQLKQNRGITTKMSIFIGFFFILTVLYFDYIENNTRNTNIKKVSRVLKVMALLTGLFFVMYGYLLAI